jgi:hypothetical protein
VTRLRLDAADGRNISMARPPGTSADAFSALATRAVEWLLGPTRPTAALRVGRGEVVRVHIVRPGRFVLTGWSAGAVREACILLYRENHARDCPACRSRGGLRVADGPVRRDEQLGVESATVTTDCACVVCGRGLPHLRIPAGREDRATQSLWTAWAPAAPGPRELPAPPSGDG